MKDLLRVLAAGSVDDGKSTLLGRLMLDAGQVPEDQLEWARRESHRRGTELDPSLLLDGLEDERAQGITIDVAYRYVSTDRRFFVLADAPGHARYTRNMATGAAGAELLLLVVDASRGVGPQTRRHAFIASLMGIGHVVVAVNKMDQVGFSEAHFDRVRTDFEDLIERLEIPDVEFVPVSALDGAHVVHPGPALGWHRGPTLLERLETCRVATGKNLVDFRLPVQLVLQGAERWIAGTVASGVLRRGETVAVLPSGERASVAAICLPSGPADEVHAGHAVRLLLDRELDVARGDVLARPDNRPSVGTELDAMLVWMDEAPLDPSRRYELRIGHRFVPARVTDQIYRLDVETGHRVGAELVAQNDIARVRLGLEAPIVFDPYRRVRDLGGCILLDRDTRATAAAGVIIERGPRVGSAPPEGNIRWLGSDDAARQEAARLAAELGADGRRVLRLDAELLDPVIGPGPGRADRALAAARLVAAAGAVPIVLFDETPASDPTDEVSDATDALGLCSPAKDPGPEDASPSRP